MINSIHFTHADATAERTIANRAPLGQVVSLNQRPASSVDDYSTECYLFGPIAQDWILVQPLELTIEQEEDESYLVSEDIFLLYGTGNTLAEALFDYSNALIEYHQLLAQRGEANPLDLPILDRVRFFLKHN